VLLDEPEDSGTGPASADATAVTGVGSTIATQLENAGITTVGGLAAAGVAVVANETELSESRARRVASRASVMALGASATTAKILVDLGLGPDVLAETGTEAVVERTRTALREDALTVRVPDDYEVDEAELEAVVERARSEQ
jgi:predicted RecB family nuclease